MEEMKPLVPVIAGIAIIGAIFAAFGWLIEHPLALLVFALLVTGAVFVLVKGKFIGGNRV